MSESTKFAGCRPRAIIGVEEEGAWVAAAATRKVAGPVPTPGEEEGEEHGRRRHRRSWRGGGKSSATAKHSGFSIVGLVGKCQQTAERRSRSTAATKPSGFAVIGPAQT